MSAKLVKLISPDNNPIVGVLLVDGSTCPVTLTHDKNLQLTDVVIHKEHDQILDEAGGKIIYIDTKGKKWEPQEVEAFSIQANH